MPHFSIIVPAYNAQDHVSSCLESAISQTFADIEIICVNDGSTDSTASILADFANRDDRIRAVSQENGGPSHARNTGIEAARGDYLVFLDSDDLLEKTACSQIAANLDGSTEAVVFGWSCFGGTPNRWMKAHELVADAYYPTFDPELLFAQNSQPFLRLAVSRNALAKQGIRFDESLRIGEDAAFLFAAYPRLTGVRLIHDQLYRYRLAHDGSIMQEVASDGLVESLHHLDMVISVFGNWASDGLLERYGSPLVTWSVKNVLYTMLRQEPPIRDELSSTLGALWRVHWTEGELRELDVPAHVMQLMRHALDTNTPHLSRDLLIYRLAEYGAVDMAASIAERFRTLF